MGDGGSIWWAPAYDIGSKRTNHKFGCFGEVCQSNILILSNIPFIWKVYFFSFFFFFFFFSKRCPGDIRVLLSVGETAWETAPGLPPPPPAPPPSRAVYFSFIYLPLIRSPHFRTNLKTFVNEISSRRFLPFNDCFFQSGVVSFRFYSPRDSPGFKVTFVSQPINKEVGARKYLGFNINFESCNFSKSRKIKCGSSRSLRMSAGHHYFAPWHLSSIEVWTEWSRANTLKRR